MTAPMKCQCGEPARGPECVLSVSGYVIRCAMPKCPAMVRDRDSEAAVARWNVMSAGPAQVLITGGMVFIDPHADYEPGQVEAACAAAALQ